MRRSQMFDLSDLVWGTLNYFKDTLASNSGDPRRDDALDFLNAGLRRTYGRDNLKDVNGFIGIILAALDTYQVAEAQKAGLLRDYAQQKDGKTDLRTAYKVYIPEIEPSPAPKGANDPILWFYPNVFPNDRVAMTEALSTGDIVKVKYRDMQNLLEPTIVSKEGHVSLAFPSVATGGLPFKFKKTPAIPGYRRSTTHTTVPQDAKIGATAFYGRLRASNWFKSYSREFLIGLTANANNESGFRANADGDHRTSPDSTTIEVNGREACSFGYWQLNVCARGGGGQSFAKYFNIDVMAPENRTAEGPLYKAITDEEKQFEFVASHLADYPTKYGPQDSVNWARLIAVHFENCKECDDLGGALDEQTRSRMSVAATLDKKIAPQYSSTAPTTPAPYAPEPEKVSSNIDDELTVDWDAD
jgi:hypothetical protein